MLPAYPVSAAFLQVQAMNHTMSKRIIHYIHVYILTGVQLNFKPATNFFFSSKVSCSKRYLGDHVNFLGINDKHNDLT